MVPLVSMPSFEPVPASIGQKRDRSLVDDDAFAAPSSDRGAPKRRRGEASGDGGREVKRYECEVCGKMLSTMRNLRQHVSVVHLRERKH